MHAAVVWAQKHYITSGVTPTEFRPSSTINRAQAVTFLFRGNIEIKQYKNKK
ncbi:MAG: S-layer homology domain-containing protein [Eubacterium sp.]|nr:S-layer homology domain-containing protein [Eubacterium sp.]